MYTRTHIRAHTHAHAPPRTRASRTRIARFYSQIFPRSQATQATATTMPPKRAKTR
jgi:hypothetical protein